MSDFATRVTLSSGVVASVVALTGGALGGASVLVGVGVGAAVTIVNFTWLARVTARAVSQDAGQRSRTAAILLVALRHLLTFAALGVPVAAGWAHPVALAAGLTVLPLSLTVQGLRVAREEP